MFNVVYVLVSTGQDYYYEQFLVSAASLKYRMKDANIVLLVEQETNRYLRKLHKEVEQFVSRIQVCRISDKYSMAERSRILKTRMRDLVRGDFLYIDCDTIICDDLSMIQDIPQTSAVLDCHGLLSDKIYEFQLVRKRAVSVRVSPGYQDRHFNSGVIWCKDDDKTREFFKRWHQAWCKTNRQGFMIDQLSFNAVNYKMRGILGELDGCWNCQLRYGLPYIANAKIIHYMKTNVTGKYLQRRFAYKFTENRMWERIKKYKEIPDDVMKLVYQPKSAFEKAMLVEIDTPDYIILKSSVGGFARWLYTRCPNLYWSIDNILERIKRVAAK